MVDLHPHPETTIDIEEFTCPICMELAYKPTVNACGHVHCFWCVHTAMNPRKESNCPICRHPFAHLPRICPTLHYFFIRYYPSEYSERARAVKDEEMKMKVFSSEVIDGNQGCLEKESRSETSRGPANVFSSSDFGCIACKILLRDPVVLNCGHAICQSCTESASSSSSESSSGFHCPACAEFQPQRRLSVCNNLKLIVQTLFPEAAKDRTSGEREGLTGNKRTVVVASAEGESSPIDLHSPNTRRKNDANEVGDVGEGSSARATVVQLAYEMQARALQRVEKASPEERKFAITDLFRVQMKYLVHEGVGCDGCGAFPIVGQRFQCKECPDKVGFDLCEECYGRQSLVKGRFNQNHTLDHKMVQVHPFRFGLFDPSEMEEEIPSGSEGSPEE